MTTANLTKVIVPCRLSYAHLWEPDSINGSEPKYSVSCIIDKNDKETIAKIKTTDNTFFIIFLLYIGLIIAALHICFNYKAYVRQSVSLIIASIVPIRFVL